MVERERVRGAARFMPALQATTLLALGWVPVGCYVGAEATAAAGDPEGSTGEVASSSGEGEEGSTGPESMDPSPEDPADAGSIPLMGARRLTPTEIGNVVTDLLGVEDAAVETYLPPTTFDPFDNDYTQQTESAALVTGVEFLAGELVEQVLAEPARWQSLAECEPLGVDDAACFSAFLSRFGRRALRRPVTDDELEAWTSLFDEGEGADALRGGIGEAIRFFLQHPEFLYRLEMGEPLPDEPSVIRLDDYEVATRLSFLLWGTSPDDWLLDLAEAGGLGSSADVADVAAEMLEHPKARSAIGRFHQMWLGYSSIPLGGELGEDMQGESQALIDRVIFEENGAWSDVFRADQTYVTASLAEHYGIDAPADANGGWVDYAQSGRGGLLSHGTFLSNGAKEGDTSPTLRGLAVRLRLMCLEIPPPPPSVNDSVPPPADDGEGPLCKPERFAAHTDIESCSSCHQAMDPIGWGLERYDQTGAFRTVEAVDPSCTIDGEGEVVGLGAFAGPGELGELLADSDILGHCAATHLYRFAMGRSELDDADEALIDAILEQTGTRDYTLEELIVGVVSDPAFFFARQPQSED